MGSKKEVIQVGDFIIEDLRNSDSVSHIINEKKEDGYITSFYFNVEKEARGVLSPFRWGHDFELVIERVGGKEILYVIHDRVLTKYNCACTCCSERGTGGGICSFFTQEKLEKALQQIKANYPEIEAFLNDEETLQERMLESKKSLEERGISFQMCTKDIVVEKENAKETLEDLTIREISELIIKIKEEFDNATGEQRDEYRECLKEL